MIEKDEIRAKCKTITREGLYIMVFIILMQTCEIDSNANKLKSIEKKISHIEEILEQEFE